MTSDGPPPVETVWDEMRGQLERGEIVRAEDYLPKNGALTDSERTLDIVYAEYCLREEAGEALELGEYLRRFPELGAELERQILLHRAVAAVVSETPVADPFPTFLPIGGTVSPPGKTIVVFGSAPTSLRRVSDRVRTVLSPLCDERTRWCCSFGGPVADAVVRLLDEEKQVRLHGGPGLRLDGDTLGGHAGTRTQGLTAGDEAAHDDLIRNADLVVAFWDGTCPETAAILELCRERKVDYVVAFV